MKPYERQAFIVDYLKEHGKTTVDALSKYFNVTGAAIRKDLTILENNDKVLRTYGSVILKPSIEDGDLPILSKTNINLDQKKRIAQAAIQFLNEGDSIIMDAGSTVLQMISLLKQFNTLTIMTNSVHILTSLATLDKQNFTMLVCGGTYRPKSGSLHGSLAESTFKKFSFDTLFIGTDGFDLELGSTTFNEVHGVSQVMCEAAHKIILLTDSSKFGRKSPNVVCPIEKIDTIITDTGLPLEIQQQLVKKGVNLILA